MPVFIENGKHNNEILIVIQYGRSYWRNVDLFNISNNSISTNTSSFVYASIGTKVLNLNQMSCILRRDFSQMRECQSQLRFRENEPPEPQPKPDKKDQAGWEKTIFSEKIN